MPLAMINVRLDAALKERVDTKLQQLGYSATQAMTAFYQYIDQNDSLPFTVETRVYRPEESLKNTLESLQAARPRLAQVVLLMNEDRLTEEARLQHCQALAIDIGMIKSDMRLYDTTGRAGEHLQHYVQSSLGEAYLALILCHSVLEDVPNSYGKTLLLKKEKVFNAALERAESRMTEMGLHQAVAVVNSTLLTGTYCTVEIYQPEGYEYGAWQVRVTLNPARKGQTVPKIESWLTFAFPKIPERIFNVASPYSMPVTVKEQLEIGFRFVEGYTFFHLYSNGTPEENNTINIDEVAGRLGDYIDSELARYLPA
ncbi:MULTISPECIES: type II toxin-antitoxin system RelB/DinJ family antitoxin [unclassified Cedecea]|uniref:type II toxin-antitoxin system RelB/DinJ family antitoxin n=1 Tax=unclassified Cedecea TaxID=2649846 RepID=UPI00301859B3